MTGTAQSEKSSSSRVTLVSDDVRNALSLELWWGSPDLRVEPGSRLTCKVAPDLCGSPDLRTDLGSRLTCKVVPDL